MHVFMLPKCTLFSRSSFLSSSSSSSSSSSWPSSSSAAVLSSSRLRKGAEQRNYSEIPEHSGRAFVHTDEQLEPERAIPSFFFFIPSGFVSIASFSLSLSLLFSVFSSFPFLFSLKVGVLTVLQFPSVLRVLR